MKPKKMYSRDVEQEVERLKRRFYRLHSRLAAHGDFAIISLPVVGSVQVDSDNSGMTVSLRVGTPMEALHVKD